MENISKKRGRQKLLSDVSEGILRTLYEGTTRNIQEKYYTNLAFELLREHEYFCNESTQKMKSTILAALGRVRKIHGDAACMSLAEYIAEHRLSTRESLIFIRDSRGFGRKKVDGLVSQIVTLINKSRLSPDEIRQLLGRLHDLTQE